jgi:hypothetical protein
MQSTGALHFFIVYKEKYRVGRSFLTPWTGSLDLPSFYVMGILNRASEEVPGYNTLSSLAHYTVPGYQQLHVCMSVRAPKTHIMYRIDSQKKGNIRCNASV